MAILIKHVQGNVLCLNIPLTVKIRTIEGGEVVEHEEDFYPDTSKPITVSMVRSMGSKISFEPQVSGNVLTIRDSGLLKANMYGIEILCQDEEGNPYRYKANSAVQVVDATRDAGIVAGVEFDAEEYTLEGAVFISYGVEQVQSDWDEQDDESKAYIKNKPDHIVTDEHYVHTDNNYTNEDKSKLDSALQSETDPTVPSWAKQPSKPSYTSQEVGALPSDTHIPADPVQSDWNEADTTALDFIKNKPDLSHFITNSVNDLVNYYLKSETYTKQEVQALIGAISQFHYEIAASTSDVTSPANNVLYLIGPTGTGGDKYEEYVWPDAQQGFVKIGDTSIDLSGYVTTTALDTALADYTTTADLTTLLAGKQDKIDSSHKLSADLIEDGSTNKAYTAGEKTKLNSIEQGAQVNVKPDWNAQSGSAAEILNKPTIPAAQIQSDWNQSDSAQKDYIKNKPTTMGASGSGHKGGLVPDTPSTAGTTKFLREDGTWVVPEGGSSYVPTLQSAPTTSTISYTKDGKVKEFEIGQFARVINQNASSGYDFYQLFDLATENNEAVAKWERVENIHAEHEDVFITVSLASDAPQGTTISGLVINAYFNDATMPTTQVTTDSNGMASLSIPNGYKYKLVFPVQQGCKEIAPVSHVATLYQRSVEVSYSAVAEDGEVITVMTMDKNASAYTALGGVVVSCTYDGTTTQYTTGSNGKVTFVVPYGKTYTVTAGTVEGKYVRNQASRTFTAESSVRSVVYIYSQFASGLFIVDSTGGEYRLDEWQEAVEQETKQNSDAKMIKVATSALANAGGIFYVSIDMLRERTGVLTGQQWASQNVEFKSIPLNGNSTSAAYYYDGLTASENIKSEGEERGIFTPAATNALNARFDINSNETKRGFLGSVGQWAVLWNNKEEVDDILRYTRPNGTYLLSTYTTQKWTSTQANANLASSWTSSANYPSKLYSYVVVPFFA